MKNIKMLGLAAIAALAAMAFVGVASASARAVYFEDGVTLAPAGTTFTASGTNVRLSNGFITNTCTGSIGGTITDNGSTGNPMTASITAASFTACNNFTVTSNNLPWGLSMAQTGNPGTISGADVTLNTLGGCRFKEDATHIVTGTWANGTASAVTLGGSMVKDAASSSFCGATGTISGTETVTSVSGGHTNLLILPAP